MRTALFAALLLCSGAALAQEVTTTTTEVDPTITTTTTMTETDPALTTVTTTMSPTTVAPDNSNPELDARGIPVISDPAMAPPGFNQPAGMTGVGGPLVDASQPPASQPATESYPPCTRTVTDNCVQTYERGRSPTG